MPRPELDSMATARRLSKSLDAIGRRVRTGDLLWAGTAASVAGALAWLGALVSRASPRTVALTSVGAAILAFAVVTVRRRARWSRREAARRAERAQPASRNLVVTAEELLRVPERASSWMRGRVVRAAAHMIDSVDPRDAAPLGRPLVCCLAAWGVWAAVAAGLPARAASLAHDATSGVAEIIRGASAPVLTVKVAAPVYLGGRVQTLKNPERVEAISGSRLSVEVSEGGPWRFRLGARAIDGNAEDVVLTESTYLAVEGDPSGSLERRLIPVVVAPDRVPTIRIDRPGKDLLVPDTNRQVAIATTATDDFGLSSLELRYTKVSGSGEQFEFEEGTLALALAKEDGRAWQGHAALALSRMQLQPGDAVVYRIVGTDARGESGSASSDTFFVEIAGPGEVTIAGFELPPDRERYALSQQMIVLKIERLRKREPTMGREAVAQEAADIAAEQRAVRSNFIFLTGGHVEDEEEEAAHSHEIQEGRLEHSARREIHDAIQHMSRAEQELVVASANTALPPARAAVEALQRAFGRNRYILRSMPVRSRLDPTRRLSANLDEAVDWNLSPPESAEDPRAAATRKLLAELIDIGGVLSSGGRVESARLEALAEAALAVDAASKNWQQISAALMRLRDAAARGEASDRPQSDLNAAVALLRAEVAKYSVPPGRALPAHTTLRSSWAEERRRR